MQAIIFRIDKQQGPTVKYRGTIPGINHNGKEYFKEGMYICI